MIDKLEKYLRLAAGKTAPLCATMLDPRLKLEFFRTHSDLLSCYNTTPAKLREVLELEAKKIDTSPPVSSPTEPKTTKTSKNNLDAQLFGTSSTTKQTLQLEMMRYFAEPTEEPGTNLLDYWKGRAKVFPMLSVRARSFLAILATSAPSERIFYLGRNILRYQRSSLNPCTVQMLLCLKEWYRTLGPLFQSAPH